MSSSIVPEKSSNEILSELFGAFNAEPPKMKSKGKSKKRSSSEDSSFGKKKKSKSKKSKKKHKSKSKKRKRKNSSGCDSISSDSDRLPSKKKKIIDNGPIEKSSPNSLSIELAIDKVDKALEILLDGTVGIKGDNGVVTQILSDGENEIEELNSHIENEVLETKSNEKIQSNKEDKTKSADIENSIKEVFEDDSNKGEQKKGKIQIKNLKFSSVYQETVKAVEEKQKKEDEKKASYEEGELSDSSALEDSDAEDDGTEKKLEKESRRKGSESKSRHRNHRDDHRSHKRDKRGSESHARRSRDRSRERRRVRETSREREREKRRKARHETSHSQHSGHSRSRSHRSRSREKRDRSREKREKSRERRERSRERREKSRERREKREKSHDAKERSHHRSKSKERVKTGEKIDKEKLLAIARRNAMKLIDAGVLPGAEKLTTIKAGGKTVNELTEYCKKLSKKEALGDEMSDIDSNSSEDEEKPFHHPFTVRDRPNSIVMNIKNSTPLPVKSLQEKAAEQSKQLRLQFPVSSGSSHRRTESEWVPVSPPRKEEDKKKPAASKAAPPAPAPAPAEAVPPLPPPPLPPMFPPVELSAVPPPEPAKKTVFPVIQPTPASSKMDISSIVSKRLEAMRRLQENPNDSQALSQMYHAQQEMQFWAETKQDMGAFTGCTGAKVLTPSELSSGVQAWAKKDQLTNATPVKGGMGMALLQKMGWQPGEGLGKNKEGTLEPLKLEVKMDKKGLLAADEAKKGRKGGASSQQGPALPTVKTLDGKHPVSLLNEFCSRRRFGVPQFELCLECGPDHKKSFLFKVKVDGTEYTPSVASPNKKQAKAEAAAICLRALGLISGS